MTSSSRPTTPSPEQPNSLAAERFKETGDPIEWSESYRPGGFHPIHIGDTLNRGQYRIIRKLGYNSYSTAWLAADVASQTGRRYVAVKVMKAKRSTAAIVNRELDICSTLARDKDGNTGSEHVLRLLDWFEEQGPNGTHTCLVCEPMGGTVASIHEYLSHGCDASWFRYPKWIAKRILRHTLLGLGYLHCHGVVHGDLQPGNLLFSMSGLGTEDEGKLRQEVRDIERKYGKTDLWAPRYLALCHPLNEYADVGQEANIKISDLGAASFTSKSPDKIVRPVALRAPEIILKQPVDEKIDIWSFGCLIYELITGTQLFGVCLMGDDKEEDADDDHLLEFHDIIGQLPDNIMAFLYL
ncbi:hypothetical protein VMCG_03421 [Cytospora schulzeri]|uniref:non-specific serine/threonine protein kinase n=1 Tax=Cytospora schulzeri TaxID=448051 RepID=A0A423WWU8_9PEZI|nr:hypothetical protein VMCG_03421 [Valsa malicola]